jgi:uncharacterized membrane protein
MKFFIWNTVLLISFIFLVPLHADSHKDLSELLMHIRNESQMTNEEKVKLLDDFSKSNIGTDSALTASLLKQGFLISSSSNTKASEIEQSLLSLGLQHPEGWQSKFRQFILLNLLHVDGQHRRVIQMGELQLVPGYFDVLNGSIDPELVLLKNFYPVNSEIMRKGVMQQLAIAYDRVGNPIYAAKLRSQASIASSENAKLEPSLASQSTPSSAIVTAVPTIIASVPEEDRDLSWLIIVSCILLATLAGAGVFLLWRKPSSVGL